MKSKLENPLNDKSEEYSTHKPTPLVTENQNLETDKNLEESNNQSRMNEESKSIIKYKNLITSKSKSF